MAFFSFLGPIIKKIATVAIPIVIGKVGSFLKEKFDDFLSGNKTVVNSTSETLGESEAYDSRTSPLEDTLNISKKLEKLKEDYLKIAETYEMLSYSNVINQLNSIKDKIEKINKVKENLIDKTIIHRMENESANLLERIKGTYNDEIINLFSLGNTEMLEILKKKGGKEKELEIKKLVEKYMTSASYKLITKLEKYMDMQIKFIKEILSSHFNNLEISEKNLKNEIEEINRAISKGKEKELEQDYLKVLNILESMKLN